MNDWEASDGAIEVLAAEVDGTVELTDTSGRSHRIAFRADRVDRADANLILTDYKTGKATNKKYLTSKKAETRQRHFVGALREGKMLQAPIYSQAIPNLQTRGRYLFLDPEYDDQDHSRELIVESEDSEVVETSTTTALTALDGWTRGTFFPRLVLPDEDKEPQACGFCSVAQACLRGDSGARARLREWTTARRDSARRDVGDSRSQLSVLLDLWFLPDNKETSS